ncbi:MAG: D-isomer specific 2-hydroxyacid dehydrogenase family protein [Lachnospiraceae bacterium]
MRIAVFSLREDEKAVFAKYAKKYNVEIVPLDGTPTPENTDWVKGCDCVNVITSSQVTAAMLDRYKELGVGFVTTRTIGYEHIDYEYAAKIGIPVSNITYSPSSVADYAIMMILMVLRKTKHIMERYVGQDYAISAIRGRELPNLTVGIVGTGKIGETVARHMTGFGCRLLAYDPYPKKSLEGIVDYVDMDTLLAQSDVVTLHVPMSEKNYHMIDREAIAKMKNQAVLINTARGPLVDSGALIEGLESGKLFGAGLDVIEGDREIYYRDCKYQNVLTHDMAILNAMPNVLMLPHMAFFTDEAVADMIEHSIESCVAWYEGREIPGRVN